MCTCVFGNFYPVSSLISHPPSLSHSISENESLVFELTVLWFCFVILFGVFCVVVWFCLVDCVVFVGGVCLLVCFFLSKEKLILWFWLVGWLLWFFVGFGLGCGFLFVLLQTVCRLWLILWVA